MIVILTLLISLIEALLLLPAHLAILALKDNNSNIYNNGFDFFAFIEILTKEDKIMNWLRDVIYSFVKILFKV